MALQSALNFNYSISNSRSAQVLGKPHPPNFRLINNDLLNIDTADLMKEEANSYEKSQSTYYPRYNETSNSSYTKEGLRLATQNFKLLENQPPIPITYERSTIAPYRPISANLIYTKPDYIRPQQIQLNVQDSSKSLLQRESDVETRSNGSVQRQAPKSLKVKIIGGYQESKTGQYEFTTKQRQFSLQSDRSGELASHEGSTAQVTETSAEFVINRPQTPAIIEKAEIKTSLSQHTVKRSIDNESYIDKETFKVELKPQSVKQQPQQLQVERGDLFQKRAMSEQGMNNQEQQKKVMSLVQKLSLLAQQSAQAQRAKAQGQNVLEYIAQRNGLKVQNYVGNQQLEKSQQFIVEQPSQNIKLKPKHTNDKSLSDSMVSAKQKRTRPSTAGSHKRRSSLNKENYIDLGNRSSSGKSSLSLNKRSTQNSAAKSIDSKQILVDLISKNGKKISLPQKQTGGGGLRYETISNSQSRDLLSLKGRGTNIHTIGSSRNDNGSALVTNSRSENACCCSVSNGCSNNFVREQSQSAFSQVQTTLSSKTQKSRLNGLKEVNLDTLEQQQTPSSIAIQSKRPNDVTKTENQNQIFINGRVIAVSELIELCKEHSSKCEQFSRQLIVRSANPYNSVKENMKISQPFQGGSARGPITSKSTEKNSITGGKKSDIHQRKDSLKPVNTSQLKKRSAVSANIQRYLSGGKWGKSKGIVINKAEPGKVFKLIISAQ
ncbi:hypothetical protein FGO68_gene8417 [Halteria grandinella]|uniref:Uncharacterized protein n=1 Tax=Halteria grandinella TaxID=5974 RepID=A0A8J8NW09_HALGN|nr:hypothetical protein FGO68_gene8417 [Halteria grandinella]